MLLVQDQFCQRQMPCCLTARIEPHCRAAAAAASCDAYLLLPCLPDELVAEVRRVLAKRPREPSGPAGSPPMTPE